MKNLKLIFGLLMSTALFTVACSDDDNEGGSASYLKIEATSPVAKDYNAQDFTLQVSTDAKALNVETIYPEGTSTGWCTAKFANQTLSIHLDGNTATEVRTATIKLSVLGVEPATVAIEQEAAPADKDPWKPESYPFEWDNNWTIDNFTYRYDGGYWKYEPVFWGENNLPGYANTSDKLYVAETSQEISIGLKLEASLLAKYGGKKLTKIECLTYNGAVPTAKLALIKANGPIANTGDLPAYVSESYSKSETICEGDCPVSDYGWAILDLSSQDISMPTSGNIFVVAYLSGNGSMIPADGGGYFAKFYYYWQPLSTFAPSYVSFENSEGKNMYKFLGGTVVLNFTVESGE